MSFEEVVHQASAMLQRRGRLTYRMLKRHFHLDAEALEDLTFELIEGQRLALDEDGAVLVWTGASRAATPDAHRTAEAERRFHTLLPAVMVLLHNQRRVTYRTLTYVFSLDATLLEEAREELTFRRVARDEDGKGLVWTGEAPSPAFPLDTPASSPAPRPSRRPPFPLPPRGTTCPPPSNGPTVLTPTMRRPPQKAHDSPPRTAAQQAPSTKGEPLRHARVTPEANAGS